MGLAALTNHLQYLFAGLDVPAAHVVFAAASIAPNANPDYGNDLSMPAQGVARTVDPPHARDNLYVVTNAVATIEGRRKRLNFRAMVKRIPSRFQKRTLLERLGIPVGGVLDLPEVVENLQDHPVTLSDFKLKPGIMTLDSFANATFTSEQQVLMCTPLFGGKNPNSTPKSLISASQGSRRLGGNCRRAEWRDFDVLYHGTKFPRMWIWTKPLTDLIDEWITPLDAEWGDLKFVKIAVRGDKRCLDGTILEAKELPLTLVVNSDHLSGVVDPPRLTNVRVVDASVIPLTAGVAIQSD
ncbi:hypothetical protein EDB92DRAFT_2101002 [Lactarius akahatsu]|uniref:Glucose-methanol-choline oxidoreductase C-terminal domain-containing protein n=1 Tax=Lactarius akahatsu TaxID=416441 RepID=A0AAD4LT09_9AGAM|nr:hypothetical protein EDB92DRAFT_2101002 [Lactarius akahatsu]